MDMSQMGFGRGTISYYLKLSPNPNIEIVTFPTYFNFQCWFNHTMKVTNQCTFVLHPKPKSLNVATQETKSQKKNKLVAIFLHHSF